MTTSTGARDDASSRGWPLFLLSAVCLLLAYGFAKFGGEVAERETVALDHAVRSWMLAHRSPAGMAFFSGITWLGGAEVLVPAAGVLLFVLYSRGARWRPVLLALGMLVFALLVSLLKARYQITRPPAGLAGGLGFSFPSGHASNSAAAWLVFTYVLLREGFVPRATLLIAALLALLVGASRVYLDVHWASDVLGGWAVGLAAGLAGCALYAALIRRSERKRVHQSPTLSR